MSCPGYDVPIARQSCRLKEPIIPLPVLMPSCPVLGQVSGALNSPICRVTARYSRKHYRTVSKWVPGRCETWLLFIYVNVGRMDTMEEADY